MQLNLNQYAGHILIVGRGDGKTLMLGTPNAGNRLSMITGQSPLEHRVHAVETEHYREIEADMIARFRPYADDGLGHWVHAEFDDVVEALNDYDPATGTRKRSGNLAVGDRAYVKTLGAGQVAAFNGLRVSFHCERLGTFILVPRAMVKPLLRAPI